jgi:hypothetical protein
MSSSFSIVKPKNMPSGYPSRLSADAVTPA